MSKRFEYVKYDDVSTTTQELFKEKFESIETIVAILPDSRYISLALTALEEAYAWIGKAIMDEQRGRGV